jgi:hypothetical protein
MPDFVCPIPKGRQNQGVESNYFSIEVLVTARFKSRFFYHMKGFGRELGSPASFSALVYLTTVYCFKVFVTT